MATYSNKGEKKSAGDCIITAVSDFAEDLLRASEIEFVDLKKMKEFNFPMMFYIVNVSIDKVLLSMKETRPDLLPPIKEFKTQENKKQKKD